MLKNPKNYEKKCIVCGRSLKGTETEIHHISYPVNGFPEVTVEIHKRCHKIIHNTKYYPGLKPREDHSTQYYEQQKEQLQKQQETKKQIDYEKRANYSGVLDIIREKEEKYDLGVPLKVIMEEAAKREIDQPFVKEVLKREKKCGGVYEPNRNKYRLVHS